MGASMVLEPCNIHEFGSVRTFTMGKCLTRRIRILRKVARPKRFELLTPGFVVSRSARVHVQQNF